LAIILIANKDTPPKESALGIEIRELYELIQHSLNKDRPRTSHRFAYCVWSVGKLEVDAMQPSVARCVVSHFCKLGWRAEAGVFEYGERDQLPLQWPKGTSI
jgi:hypothetical protein